MKWNELDCRAFPCGEADGMTLRDYFAAAALPACIASYDRTEEAATANEILRMVTQAAYATADAMLAERQK